MRQFHQIGVELLGVAQPLGDVEIVALGVQILRELGIIEHTVLELNTLGDGESRQSYRKALVAYFEGHRDRLSADSRDRLTRNPLRILDSKDEGDRRLVADAPLFAEHLNQASGDFFAEVTASLDALGIAYRLNPRLVRGLDYYCHTAFEFTTDQLGAQGTVMGGGRYDGLVGMMGGSQTPGVGWAAGIERLAMLLQNPPIARRPIAIVPVGEEAATTALTLAVELRGAGHVVELGYGGNLGKRMKRANKLNARAAVIIGTDELARNAATLRDLDSGEQEEVPLAALRERLTRFR
jgi:histidyl-tRNA synthetase